MDSPWQSLIKRFGVWASSMSSPSLFCSSCLWSVLSGWDQSHCFLLLPKCQILLCEIDSLEEHRRRRVWKSNLSLLQAKSLDGANPWCPAEPNLPWMLVSFPRDSTHCTTQLQKQLSTGGWWCWCHFSSCSENHCGRLFKWDQLGGFLEFFDLQVKIMRLFKNKQRCCSNEAGCCCEFGCTVCLS